ncbi:MAG TPA: cytochrome c biogenesis protein CcsA [Candidatus Angelobacter sp.]|nr:cytochrome c biogenesis protein CcsA [Candidatus Angelobacter sp.]
MKTKLFFVFAAFCCAFLAYGTYQALVVAPTEETMGDVQRIFYVHVPAATVGFTLFFVNFIASLAYLWKRSPKADALAAASAEVGVVFCSVVLITGPIWARYAWGVWWSPWDMRLNTTLMLWLLYVSYLILRKSSTGSSTSVLASALAVFAFLDVPIVYMANRWFRTHHPAPMIGTPNLDHRMQNILFINMLAFLVFGSLIAWFRYELERTTQKINAAHVRRAATGGAAMLALPAMFLATPNHVNPTAYLWGGYLAAWGIYVGYLLFLMSKLAKLKKETAEL